MYGYINYMNAYSYVRACIYMCVCIYIYMYIYIHNKFIHFRANTLGKGMNPLILPAMG